MYKSASSAGKKVVAHDSGNFRMVCSTPPMDRPVEMRPVHLSLRGRPACGLSLARYPRALMSERRSQASCAKCLGA